MSSGAEFNAAGKKQHDQRARSLPRWMEDPVMRKRVLNIYRDYMRCLTIPEIQGKYAVAIATIYRDIDRARSLGAERFAANFDVLQAERIEAQRSLIRDAREMIIEIDIAGVNFRNKYEAKMRVMDYIAEREHEINLLSGVQKVPGTQRAVKGESGVGNPLLAAGNMVVVIAGATGERGVVELQPAPLELSGPITDTIGVRPDDDVPDDLDWDDEDDSEPPRETDTAPPDPDSDMFAPD